jgi:hypothetical protein
MRTILEVRWFSNGVGTVGIAKVQTKHEGIEYRISAVRGLDEAMDTETIVDWGAWFPTPAGEALFGAKPDARSVKYF